MKRLAKVALALLVAWAALEGALRLAPGLLPRAYLARFPGNGCEFFHPGILARTPVEGVLLPHLASAHRGPPPADLVELGLAPSGSDDDAREFPEVVLPADALGFPNEEEHERAELVLVGDSFGVAAGVRSPEGLQAALERTTGWRVHNLSLAGLGPVQERWLVETLGLAMEPKAVLWLYFAGNDLTASYEPLLARRDGKRTWAEAWPERQRPMLVVPELARMLFARGSASAGREPLPGFAFPTGPDATRSVWFQPDYLRQLGWTRAQWEAHPVWAPVQTELRAAYAACKARGVRFVLVYLPSKEAVLLPCVARDPGLAQRTLEALGTPAAGWREETGWEELLAQRHAQEQLVHEFCGRESIPFFSATPALEAQAARGELGYLALDTHWQSKGQAVVLEPLLGFLRELGLMD